MCQIEAKDTAGLSCIAGYTQLSSIQDGETLTWSGPTGKPRGIVRKGFRQGAPAVGQVGARHAGSRACGRLRAASSGSRRRPRPVGT
jgi:hypothetical protein